MTACPICAEPEQLYPLLLSLLPPLTTLLSPLPPLLNSRPRPICWYQESCRLFCFCKYHHLPTGHSLNGATGNTFTLSPPSAAATQPNYAVASTIQPQQPFTHRPYDTNYAAETTLSPCHDRIRLSVRPPAPSPKESAAQSPISAPRSITHSEEPETNDFSKADEKPEELNAPLRHVTECTSSMHKIRYKNSDPSETSESRRQAVPGPTTLQTTVTYWSVRCQDCGLNEDDNQTGPCSAVAEAMSTSFTPLLGDNSTVKQHSSTTACRGELDS